MVYYLLCLSEYLGRINDVPLLINIEYEHWFGRSVT